MSTKKTVFVTGASGLLGGAISKQLLQSNYQVCGIYNTHTPDHQLTSHSGFFPIQCNLACYEQIKKLTQEGIKRHGQIDALVCNAGLKTKKQLLFCNQSDIEQLIMLNLTSVILLVKLFSKQMITKKHGKIIIIGSRAGSAGMPGQSVYAATKSALVGFVKSMAFELGNFGITINLISPGAIKDTNEKIYSKKEQDNVIQYIGLKRLGLPKEVADLVDFLCSDKSSYINGADIAIDGAARF